MTRRLLQPVRFTIVLASILVFLSTMSAVYIVERRRWHRVRLSNRLLRHFCRFGLWLLNVRVRAPLADGVEAVGHGLFVGNHLSYLDVLVVASRVPACFVTSVEIRETPVLGQICRMAGCLFVERRNKMNIHKEVAEITEGLRAGLKVAIFPEATSTNGEQILRFRRPLYVAAVDAPAPIVPFCLNYRRVGESPINIFNRDKVFWYGDMSFAPHLWDLAGSGGIEVDLHFLEPLDPAAHSDAKALADQSHALVSSVFAPVKPD